MTKAPAQAQTPSWFCAPDWTKRVQECDPCNGGPRRGQCIPRGEAQRKRVHHEEEEQGSGRNFPRQREMKSSGLCDDEGQGGTAAVQSYFPPAILKVNCPNGAREGGLGHRFLSDRSERNPPHRAEASFPSPTAAFGGGPKGRPTKTGLKMRGVRPMSTRCLGEKEGHDTPQSNRCLRGGADTTRPRVASITPSGQFTFSRVPTQMPSRRAMTCHGRLSKNADGAQWLGLTYKVLCQAFFQESGKFRVTEAFRSSSESHG